MKQNFYNSPNSCGWLKLHETSNFFNGFWHHIVEKSRNKIASDCHCHICWVCGALQPHPPSLSHASQILSAQDVSRFQCRGRWASCRPGWPLTWRGICLSWPWRAQGWNLHKLGGAMWWLKGTRAKFVKTTLLASMANFWSASNLLSALQSYAAGLSRWHSSWLTWIVTVKDEMEGFQRFPWHFPLKTH